VETGVGGVDGGVGPAGVVDHVGAVGQAHPLTGLERVHRPVRQALPSVGGTRLQVPPSCRWKSGREGEMEVSNSDQLIIVDNIV